MDAALGIFGLLASGLLGGGIAMWSSSRQKASDAEMELWKQKMDHRREQLSALYAPLTSIRSKTRSLRLLLPSEVDGQPWRLVHHIGDIRKQHDLLAANPTYDPKPVIGLTAEQVAIARLIVTKYGHEACELLQDKASLIEGKMPAGIEKYEAHQSRLRAGWDEALNQPTEDGMTFPGQRVGQQHAQGISEVPPTPADDVDVAIREGRTAVESARDALLSGGPLKKSAIMPGVLIIAGIALGVAVGILYLAGPDRPTRLLVTTPDGVVCGEPEIDEAGNVSIEGNPLDNAAQVDVVDSCT